MRRTVVVRDRVGRNRYVAFLVSPPVGRARIAAALRDGPAALTLIEYDGARGLVRCPHLAKDAAIAFLNALLIGPARVSTTGTSGTIRKARAKYLAPREQVK